ncbi:hypothetical protein [Amycolatopsis nalaikhensis]|uniref:Uncharacterized protein n=1 Tax=Amycolatopsis nalaikhensis TaxID=715472 RepID=A0ABY8XYJ1_9PSEU|nr:hypothetical protein [Amycolatopsis sp. 2-2]WIV60663.1 hypothetical protein QP939_19655 [Amycolatopsis sp. 2-2]
MSNNLMPYLRAVADVLGEPWRAATSRCVGEDAALVGPDGGWISVTVSSSGSGERLVLEAWLDSELSPHQPTGMVRPSVTVARARPAAAVGKDVARRLIPDVVELIAAARDLAHRRACDAADLSNVLAAIGAGFGTTPEAGANTVSVGAYGQPLFATAQVLQPIWRSRQRRVRFSIDATVENALALAALVGERAAADRATPVAPDSGR